ncbi:hypothetical protein [Streptomyces cavernae]|uniref:hypothetical protein n=1 Tax=Streptomyces cavernae TaxID=2259034 RepID=UPI000FEBF20E|nr:hypothetical protein [Streptomyces cavernae]
MTVEQLPGEVREFAQYLNRMLMRIDQRGGWCAVFWQRDPDGMRACLDGTEVPPWDVVEALLMDLATAAGADAAAREKERARALHTASLTAYDARPGGREELGDRLDQMLREQRHAAERRAELTRRLGSATSPQEAEGIRLDLAWATDDHERATARCAELRSRMAELAWRAVGGHPPRGREDARRPSPGQPDAYAHATARADEAPAPRTTAFVPEPTTAPSVAPDDPFLAPSRGDVSVGAPATPDDDFMAASRQTRPHTGAPGPADPANPADLRTPGTPGRPAIPGTPGIPGGPGASEFGPAPGPGDPGADADASPKAKSKARQRFKRRTRGSARFAGMVEEEAVEPVAVPTMAAPSPAPASRSPRGARFAGAADAAPEPAEPPQRQLGDEAGRITAETVATLVRLRTEGRGGEAHGVLVEAAHWPADRFPLLADQLQRAGLSADWATLLWEAASLPPHRLVAVAAALAAAGRAADGEQMLRQGVTRPAEEIGEAALGLVEEGRRGEARSLLDAYVRIRPPADAARSAAVAPDRLVPLLLEAARGVSQEHHRDLLHAVRMAGLTA